MCTRDLGQPIDYVYFNIYGNPKNQSVLQKWKKSNLEMAGVAKSCIIFQFTFQDMFQGGVRYKEQSNITPLCKRILK